MFSNTDGVGLCLDVVSIPYSPKVSTVFLTLTDGQQTTIANYKYRLITCTITMSNIFAFQVLSKLGV